MEPAVPETVERVGLLLRESFDANERAEIVGWHFSKFDPTEPELTQVYLALVGLKAGNVTVPAAHQTIAEVFSQIVQRGHRQMPGFEGDSSYVLGDEWMSFLDKAQDGLND